MLMQLVKVVASATTKLVLIAKNVAQKMKLHCRCSPYCPWLTLCQVYKFHLQYFNLQRAQNQLGSPTVGRGLHGGLQGSLVKQVGVAATAITQALNDLLQHIKQHVMGRQPIGHYNQATGIILSVTENIFSSMVDTDDTEGETNVENLSKLLSAAKILVDTTAKMVEAAKRAAADLDSEEQQQWLPKVAEGLSLATNTTAQNAIKKKLVHKLEFLPSTKSSQDAQSQLNQAAVGLNQYANKLVQVSRGTPQDLATSSSKFGQDFNEFL
ncbi:hypothetical protein BTVI_145376 [Pitangus sulphuratus]|nr:hypothetical protein BTVI_145376 [Pitangus sulphuratus]